MVLGNLHLFSFHDGKIDAGPEHSDKAIKAAFDKIGERMNRAEPGNVRLQVIDGSLGMLGLRQCQLSLTEYRVAVKSASLVADIMSNEAEKTRAVTMAEMEKMRHARAHSIDDVAAAFRG